MSSNLEELFALYGYVEELHFDEEFADHMASESRQYGKHSVSQKEIRQTHAWAPKYFKNEGTGKRAPVIMVGPEYSGRMIVVAIEPTHTTGMWHPVTAFEANAHHRESYEEITE